MVKKGNIPWNKGKVGVYKQSEATKKKLRGKTPWNKGKTGIYSEETKKAMGAKNIGKSGNSGSFKKGNAPWIKGKKHSTESREKTSSKLKGRSVWNKNTKGQMPTPWNKGKKHSTESREKMSLALKGRTPWNKGKPMSKEKRKEMEPVWEKNRNYKHTAQAKKKIRESRRHQVFPPKDSVIEIILQQELKKNGIAFRKHEPLVGQPDIFIEPNICIMADSDWFHGYKYLKGHDCSKYPIFNNVYFDKKIAYDKKITKQLTQQGYKVLRFWEHEIKEETEKCLQKILKKIQKR